MTESKIKRWLGIDGVDLVVHVGVTLCLNGLIVMTDGPEALFPVLWGCSLVVLAVRRRLAFRRAAKEVHVDTERLAEVEDRVGYLEQLQDRVVELEERLDFAERMLASKPESKARLPQG
jgi:hypothetical protein